MPIPQPIPGPTGVRQADGLDLCHGLPSEAAKTERVACPEEGAGDTEQTLPLASCFTLEAPWPLGKVKSISSLAFLSPGDCFLSFYK